MTPEEKIAITTSRQAIVVAIIGAIASILISFRGDILPKVETENMESIQERIDQKVNEVVTARLELTDDKIEYQTMPIGAIITSILDYDSFLDLNNSTQRNFDIEKSEWSPCDGRSVAGSKYGYKKPIAPDLRGLFIRGVNDMGVPGSNRINDNQLNPEKKNVGEFQSDAIRSY